MTLVCAKKYWIKIKGLIINNVPNNPIVCEKYFIEKIKAFSDIEILALIPKYEN